MLSQATIDKIKNKRKKPEYYKLVQDLKNKFNIIIFTQEFFEQGKGSFGKCYLGKIIRKEGQQLQGHFFEDLVKNDQIIAVKVMSKENFRNTQDLYQRQIKNLSKINNENVVRVLPHTMQSQKNYYIVMEYCNNRTLYELIESRKGLKRKFTIYQFIQIMFDLINGYKALKTQNIVHNDIKPQNIFIKNKVFKIGDFGLSLKLNQQKGQIYYGTLHYASPQKLNPFAQRQDIDHKSDIYSIGLILYEILYGKHPYYNKQAYQQFKYYQEQKIKTSKKYPNYTPKQLKNFILLQYITQQSKKPAPKLNLQPFDKQYNPNIEKLQQLVEKMCHLDKTARLSLAQISQRLSQLALKIKIGRSDLFADLSDFSSSQFKFQIMRMTKFAISRVQSNSLRATVKSSSAENSTNKKVQQMKNRLQTTLELIRIIKTNSQFLFDPSQNTKSTQQYQTAFVKFQELLTNYLYFINLRELKLAFEEQSTIKEEESKAADQQDIQNLIQQYYQNDHQLYNKVNYSLENYSSELHAKRLVEFIKDYLRNYCIDKDNWSQIIAWILLHRLIQIEIRYENDQNKENMQNEMFEIEKAFKLFSLQHLSDDDIKQGNQIIHNAEKQFAFFY